MVTPLKHCPFCGAIPERPGCYRGDSDVRPKWGWVECGCGARAGDVRTGYRPVEEWAEKADTEWDIRAAPEEASNDDLELVAQTIDSTRTYDEGRAALAALGLRVSDGGRQ